MADNNIGKILNKEKDGKPTGRKSKVGGATNKEVAVGVNVKGKDKSKSIEDGSSDPSMLN